MAVTSGATWRADYQHGYEITLPSGFVASIRPISSQLLFSLGLIPDVLMQMVIDDMAGKAPIKMDTTTPDGWRKYLLLINAITEGAFVSPRIVKEPQADDEVMIEAIAFEDKAFLLHFFNQPASFLKEFRDKQVRDVGVVDAVAGHEPEAVATPEPERVGG